MSYAALGTLLLIAIQTALIVGLLVQHRRRRRAETTARRLAGKLLTAQEAERTRIARDLHDGLCQEIAGVAVDITYLRNKSGANPELQQMWSSVQQRTARIAEHMRLLSHDLHPAVLQHIGLVASLQAHCADVERQHKVQVLFSVDGDIEPTTPKMALSLFRIAQEALRNTAAHGHARHATVSLARENGDLTLAVTDDGVGFDPAAARQRNGGLGLVSIEERARMVQGEVRIKSRRGDGTTIEVRIPVEAGAQFVERQYDRRSTVRPFRRSGT